MLTYLGVAATIALLLVLRRTDAITNPQFWAEDGTVFFQENLKLGCWAALHRFFRGYPYLWQRLMACAATPFPIASVPLVYNIAAYAAAAASLAAFSLPSFRHMIRSDALRAVFCLAVAALPQARELVGSLTNTSWYLGIWLMLLTIMRLPRSPLALAALAVVCVLATFSTPLSILTAPLWFARALHAWRRKHLYEAGFAIVALCALLALVFAAGDLGRDKGPPLPLLRPLINVVSLRVLADAALGPRLVESLVDSLGVGVVYALAASLVAVLAALGWQTRRHTFPVLLYSSYGIVASCALALLGHRFLAALATNLPYLIEWRVMFSYRYQVPAVGLLYLAFLATIDRLPRPSTRAIASVSLVAWLVATQATTFVLPPFHDLQWPSHAAQLERKLKPAGASVEPLIIPINPDRFAYRFKIAFDERANAPDVKAPANVIVGPLLDTTTLQQVFVARCSDLSEIDLWFGIRGRPVRQTVHIELSDALTGETVAALTLQASAIVSTIETAVAAVRRNSWLAKLPEHIEQLLASPHPMRVFYFPPIHDSAGRRYVITIRASGGAPGNSVTVYGTGADAYRDGEARRNGELLADDLAFRYGCTRP